ncbi:MAG: Nif3-like dinuclear metal center hexameric protein [bacterium]
MLASHRNLRRLGVTLAGVLLLHSPASAQEKPLTAREVVARIQEHVGIPWRSETVDTFKAGDPDQPVTGVAVTMMATLDVLQRAAAVGDTLVITHEPVFYGHLDDLAGVAQGEKDPVVAAKRAFIAEHGLRVFRFHDHWHARTPDGILAGMMQSLQWQKFQDPKNPYLFVLPETTVEGLAAQIKSRLGIAHALRVVGDPGMKLTRVAFAPGSPGFGRESAALALPEVEVLVVGETREWESVEYAADAVSEGKRKALIVLGHVPSEQAGMEECARWLRTFLGGLRVDFLPTRDPFVPPTPRAPSAGSATPSPRSTSQ